MIFENLLRIQDLPEREVKDREWRVFFFSAHGIPRAYISQGRRRQLWLLLFFVCVVLFSFQAYFIVHRFRSKPIIVGVQIKFERIPFPSVTVCNLNPYKNSLARQMNGLKDTLQAYENEVDRSREMRRRRSHSHSHSSLSFSHSAVSSSPSLSPHYSYSVEGISGSCPPNSGFNINEECTCMYAAASSSVWSCSPSREWELARCQQCDPVGFCSRASPPGHSTNHSLCLCHANGFCLRSHDHLEFCAAGSVSLSRRACHSEECICVEGECAVESEWDVSGCGLCDWRGRCLRSGSAWEAEERECLCLHELCFALRPSSFQDLHEDRTIRVRRQNQHSFQNILSHQKGLLVVNAACNCEGSECRGVKEPAFNESSMCFCFYNKNNDVLWPCYPPSSWEERNCSRCSWLGDCLYPMLVVTAGDPCLCAIEIKACFRLQERGAEPGWAASQSVSSLLTNIWDLLPPTEPSVSKKNKEKQEKAFGFKGVKDVVALKAKASESIQFVVNRLNETEKQLLSHPKTEFITKCSFNGNECSIEEDFTLHIDPSFGNCYTFNYDHNMNVTSERAGPTYGLRFQVFVNVSEYLPTTEAAGVRLTVHSPVEQPFPDTLGYSAPTGFVSSFAIRLKHITRLPEPYGDCVDDGKDDNFIYRDKQYSTEGCQRSCIQRHLVEKCGCGDPRFPLFRSSENCAFDDPESRACLEEQTRHAARFMDRIGCECKQPCKQEVYSVSYSASRWPAAATGRPDCPRGLSPLHCLSYFREQAAMVEVFFEQLNYEALVESEAYGLSNLLSDFGGQLGLWMGVSVITICEVPSIAFCLDHFSFKVGILVLDVLSTLLCCHLRKAADNSAKSSKRTVNGTTRRSALRHRSLTPSARNPKEQHFLCPRLDLSDVHPHDDNPP